jgi:F-type H+-transporting ATPase subunit b
MLSASSGSLASIDSLGSLAAAPQAITVDVDLTFVVQVVLIVVLTLVLKPLLFDPMLRLFAEREKRIDGAKVLARKIDEKSGAALATYEAEMAKARAAANSERDKIRAEAVKREQDILGAVRAATSKALEEGKVAAHAEAERVRSQLKSDASAIAGDLASRVLGREVRS